MSMAVNSTGREAILSAIGANREFFRAGGRDSVRRRREMLKHMLDFLHTHRDKVFSALNADLHKSEFEAAMTEYMPACDAIKYMIRKLPRFAKPKRAGLSIFNFPARARIMPEPYGQVLVFATWNYPLLLALEPAAGALAAGNRVVLKLSDKAQRTTQFLRWMIGECFPNGEMIAVHEELAFDEILNGKFDYIFFTGGEAAGKRVYERAASQLTPVTLELGGKSPCIVCKGADLTQAAKRIAWGKFTNAGQTCIAPDYLLVQRGIKEPFLIELRRFLREFYGDEPVNNPDYPWIVNERQYERLAKLTEHGRLVAGGERNPDRFCIAPTVIDGIGWDDPLMEQEIFGPVLPVLVFDSDEDVLAMLEGRPKPLALYCFGGGRAFRRTLLDATSSGAVLFDDVVMHFINPGLPFGGVGASGIGRYHGRYTFDTFTHYKPVMYQSTLIDWPVRYPPFTGWKRKLMRYLTR
ncbi:MAG: aldehyde dehydrogenase family protein [Lentisphaeria bacterium]|nr:aldehyde dehydrogenase family protein [Lentisphaeria bacterium]